jgi:hypothetical protein
MSIRAGLLRLKPSDKSNNDPRLTLYSVQALDYL